MPIVGTSWHAQHLQAVATPMSIERLVMVMGMAPFPAHCIRIRGNDLSHGILAHSVYLICSANSKMIPSGPRT
jgi:hypothetical protein